MGKEVGEGRRRKGGAGRGEQGKGGKYSQEGKLNFLKYLIYKIGERVQMMPGHDGQSHI